MNMCDNWKRNIIKIFLCIWDVPVMPYHLICGRLVHFMAVYILWILRTLGWNGSESTQKFSTRCFCMEYNWWSHCGVGLKIEPNSSRAGGGGGCVTGSTRLSKNYFIFSMRYGMLESTVKLPKIISCCRMGNSRTVSLALALVAHIKL